MKVTPCYFCYFYDSDGLSSGVPSCASCRRTHELEEVKPKEDSARSKVHSPAGIPFQPSIFSATPEEREAIREEALKALCGNFDPDDDYVFSGVPADEPDPNVTCAPGCPYCAAINTGCEVDCCDGHTLAFPIGTGCADDCSRCKAGKSINFPSTPLSHLRLPARHWLHG